MSLRQTRRSISIKGETYRRLKAVCEAQGESVSGKVEDLIAPIIADTPDPGAASDTTRQPTGPKPQQPERVGFEDLDALSYAFGPKFSGGGR